MTHFELSSIMCTILIYNPILSHMESKLIKIVLG